MLTRSMFSFLMMALVIASVDTAFGQPTHPYHQHMVTGPTAVGSVTSLLTERFRPVHIKRLDVPEQVAAGESSHYSVIANVESATLPINAVWHFGDEIEKRGLSVDHSFAAPGEYEVRVEVSNRRSSESRTFTVDVVDQDQQS